MNFEEIKNDVKSKMSAERFEHTCGVVKAAEALADLYNVDKEKAKIAALVHDIAKEMTEEEVNKYCEENNVNLGEIKQYPKVIHSHVGSCIAKSQYGIEDEDMLNAIKYHTTGRPDMSMLEKVVYLADFLDETRNVEKYQDTYDKVKELAYGNNMEEAMKVVLERTIMYLKGNIYIDTVNAFSYYNK